MYYTYVLFTKGPAIGWLQQNGGEGKWRRSCSFLWEFCALGLHNYLVVHFGMEISACVLRCTTKYTKYTKVITFVVSNQHVEGFRFRDSDIRHDMGTLNP